MTEGPFGREAFECEEEEKKKKKEKKGRIQERKSEKRKRRRDHADAHERKTRKWRRGAGRRGPSKESSAPDIRKRENEQLWRCQETGESGKRKYGF